MTRKEIIWWPSRNSRERWILRWGFALGATMGLLNGWRIWGRSLRDMRILAELLRRAIEAEREEFQKALARERSRPTKTNGARR